MAYVNNLRTFVRVFELGSMSAAARDQGVSPAVASSRISELEKHLGVRLFNRTTRTLQPTEHGRIFYDRATRVLDSIRDAEAAVADATNNPRGSIYVAAPLGLGRRIVGPKVPEFRDRYPMINVRLRLSDRLIDVAGEGLDLAFTLGELKDSDLRVRSVTTCPRVLCAAPSYVEARGMPADGNALVTDKHDCLLLRFPGATESQWTLTTKRGPQRFVVSGPFEADDGDVLTQWAIDGRGIVNKPVFEIAEHLLSGRLVQVAAATPATAVPLSCLYPHKRYQDPKSRLFIDFMIAHCREALGSMSDAVFNSLGKSNTQKAKREAARGNARSRR